MARDEAPATLPADAHPALAVMGTVPIYWGEVDDMADLLQAGTREHWARAVLERDYALVPLDTLQPQALAGHSRLLLAQPRALSPAENVALDAWVRGGGQLLLFADPLMTGESRFAIGDRRRPQDVVLLSPILSHWELDLRFDEQQPAGLRLVRLEAGAAGGPGIDLPVNLPGELGVEPGGGCFMLGAGIAAQCTVGAGRVLVVADAAVLDFAGPLPGAAEALADLSARAFAQSGDILHRSTGIATQCSENNSLDCRAGQTANLGGGPAPPS